MWKFHLYSKVGKVNLFKASSLSGFDFTCDIYSGIIHQKQSFTKKIKPSIKWSNLVKRQLQTNFGFTVSILSFNNTNDYTRFHTMCRTIQNGTIFFTTLNYNFWPFSKWITCTCWWQPLPQPAIGSWKDWRSLLKLGSFDF